MMVVDDAPETSWRDPFPALQCLGVDLGARDVSQGGQIELLGPFSQGKLSLDAYSI